MLWGHSLGSGVMPRFGLILGQNRADHLGMMDEIRAAVEDARPEGVTNYRLAKHLGVHQSTIDRFLNGERGLGDDLLDRLCNLLGITITTKTTVKIDRARARRNFAA